MNHTPDLYLSSLESSRFEPVRRCRLIRRLRFDTGKPCALVSLDPPVIGQDFGELEDLAELIVTARHEGASLFPIEEFPLFVHLGLLRAPGDPDVISAADVEVIGWGELYRTADDAENHRFG